MEIREQIKQGMERWGQTVSLTDGHWNSQPYRALLQSLRYKNKMYLGGVQTPIGTAGQDYYLYIGPYDHRLDKLGPETVLQRGNDYFHIVKSEAVYAGEQVCYLWAVVHLVEEDV